MDRFVSPPPAGGNKTGLLHSPFTIHAVTGKNHMASIKELFDLSGRVSVVTGGATGLGLQMATGLAEAGSNVVVCSRKLENCEQAAAELERLGVKALGLACDVTKPDQVEAVKDATLRKFGRVDVLINNSGRAWVAP